MQLGIPCTKVTGERQIVVSLKFSVLEATNWAASLLRKAAKHGILQWNSNFSGAKRGSEPGVGPDNLRCVLGVGTRQQAQKKVKKLPV